MKTKTLIYITIILLFGITIKAQDWKWVKQYTNPKNCIMRGLAVDENDNIAVSLWFADSVRSADIGTINAISQQDILVAKYNENGLLLWNKRIGGPGKDQCQNIEFDNSGNAIVVGKYDETFDIETYNIPVHTAGYDDVFMAKYDPNGNLLWAKRVAFGPDMVQSYLIAIDANNNIYLTSSFLNAAYFDNDTLTSNGHVNHFIAKYRGSGDFVWARQIFGNSDDFARNKLIEINAVTANDIYVGGYFIDSLNFGGTKIKAQGTFEDMVFAKLDSTGTFQWVRQGGSSTGLDRCNGISAGIYGNIYITGYITGNAKFDSTGTGLLNSSTLSSAGSFDFFIAKYNKTGTLIWKKRIGNTGSDIAYGAFITEKSLQVVGNYSGQVIFNNDTLNSRGLSDQDIAVFTYDLNGNPISANSVHGPGTDIAELIASDSKRNVIFSGYFRSDTLYVDDQILLKNTLSVENNYDVVFAKYKNYLTSTVTYQQNISCNEGNDGEVIVTPYFGVPKYAYTWSGNVPNSVDSFAYNLPPGTYTVTITDMLDSSTVKQIIITEPDELITSISSTNITCYLENNGIIDLEVAGGVVSGDYDYNWTGGSGLNPTIQDQSGLSAAKYNVTVTDDNNCKAYDSVTIIQPGRITFSGTVATPAIPPGSGAIDLQVNGGTPVFNYIWDKYGIPLAGRTSDTLNNLYGGLYGVTVTDNNSCQKDTSIVVPENDLLIAFIDSIVYIKCNGNNNGYARVNVNDDQGYDFSYNWEDMNRLAIGTDTNYINNIAGGKYYVTVTENGGLFRIDSTFFTINEPDTITTSIDTEDPTCYSEMNGVLNLNVTGGTPNYTYLWSTGETSEDLSLQQGSLNYFVVTVTDANKCPVIDSALLNNPAEIIVTVIEFQSILCNGYLTGILRADVTGEQGELAYFWDDPGNQTSQIATNLPGGMFEVLVIDSTGCEGIGSYNLTEPEALSFTQIDTSHVTCRGNADGSITLTPGGGTEPYVYAWSPIDFGNISEVTGLGPLQYSVSVTDDNNCPPIHFTFTVSQPATNLNIAETDHVDVSCYNENSGSFTLEATGGWLNFEYSINGTDWQTNPVFSDLIANSYNVNVRDDGNCIENLAIDIEEPSEIIVQDPIINNNTIIIVASGGTLPLTYSLNGGILQTSGTFSDLPDGEYVVSVSDANGCGPVNTETIIIVTGINDIDNNLIKIYPVPAENELYIEIPEIITEEITIEIFNMVGELVYSKQDVFYQKTLMIYLSDQTAGLYYLKIREIGLNKKIAIQ